MSLNLINLDESTRKYMLEEIELDLASGNLYYSSRLSDKGKQDYPQLLKDASQLYDIAWLSNSLRSNGRIKMEESRRTRSGGYSIAKVPVTAPDTLAEGEFNRFYIRGLCLRAIEEGIDDLVIYRAKLVDRPRSESELMIGRVVQVKSLLQDIRTHPGTDTALGLPPGPNSGLSVMLPNTQC